MGRAKTVSAGAEAQAPAEQSPLACASGLWFKVGRPLINTRCSTDPNIKDISESCLHMLEPQKPFQGERPRPRVELHDHEASP